MNDLDVEMLGSLENVLLDFLGCVVVVSYDWWFFDCVVMYIFVYEGDDEDFVKWYWFEGNFEFYEVNKVECLGVDVVCLYWVMYCKFICD